MSNNTTAVASKTNNKKALVKQNSLILANKNVSLTKYVDSVRKKQEEDEDYAKWDTSVILNYLN